jgi:hypothetical protein
MDVRNGLASEELQRAFADGFYVRSDGKRSISR